MFNQTWQILKLRLDIIKTNILTKFQHAQTKNPAFRVLTRFSFQFSLVTYFLSQQDQYSDKVLICPNKEFDIKRVHKIFLYAHFVKNGLYYSFTCDVQYVVSQITWEAFVPSSPNLVRMWIGITSWISLITSHIA